VEVREMRLSARTLGVLADTHHPRCAWPEWLDEALRGVDVILHAGDVTDAEALARLGHLAPVVAVAGNNDLPALGLPDAVRLVVEGWRIVLCHGHLGDGRDTAERVRRLAAPWAHVAIFGHTHRPCWTLVSGTLLLNPGAAAGTLPAGWTGVARLTLGERLQVSFLGAPTPGRAE
jgi:putative phosphoesterase